MLGGTSSSDPAARSEPVPDWTTFGCAQVFEVTALREIFEIRTNLSDVPGADAAEMRRLTIEA